MDLRLTVSGLDTFARNLARAPEIAGQEYARAMQESVLIAEGEIVTRTPVADTGRARGGIHSRVEGAGLALRGIAESAPLDYILPLEEGSVPHEIRPRTKKALAFRVGGALIIRRKVRHPGTKAHWMFRDGTAAATPRVFYRFRAASARVTRRVASG